MWIGLGCEKESIPELTEKYLTVDDAKYKSGKLPTGKEDVITDVQINKSVINGGSAILIVSASEPLHKFTSRLTALPAIMFTM